MSSLRNKIERIRERTPGAQSMKQFSLESSDTYWTAGGPDAIQLQRLGIEPNQSITAVIGDSSGQLAMRCPCGQLTNFSQTRANMHRIFQEFRRMGPSATLSWFVES